MMINLSCRMFNSSFTFILFAIITSMFLLTAVGRFAKGEPFKFALRVSIPAQAEEPGSDLQLLLYCGL